MPDTYTDFTAKHAPMPCPVTMPRPAAASGMHGPMPVGMIPTIAAPATPPLNLTLTPKLIVPKP